MGNGQSDETGTAQLYETFSFQSTFVLQKGDEIWLEINSMSTGVYLYGDYYTHFSGHLLKENLTSHSLKDIWTPPVLANKYRKCLEINATFD